VQLREAALIHTSVSTGEWDAGEGLKSVPASRETTKSLSLEWEEDKLVERVIMHVSPYE